MRRTLTTDDFKKRSISIWGDTIWNYNETNYTTRNKKLTLICNKHNHKFEQIADAHLKKKNGCYFCNRGKTNIDFIKQSKKIWGDKFDYTKLDYKKSNDKIILICKKHNHEFLQLANNHLQNRNGCKYCKINYIDNEKFIKQSKKIWGDKFDYSKVEYINSYSYITLICKTHNYEFKQRPDTNLNNKCGCKYCNTGTTEDFIKKANIVHNNMYDYSKTVYIKSSKKIIIKCKKHNKEFKQTPNNHLSGNGCPICNSSKGEILIENILKKLNILYKKEVKFNNCKDKDYLKFDFYLPNHNLCIEYDGIQHFKPIKAWNGEKGFKLVQKRDNIKNNYCKINNIKLLRFNYREKNQEKIETKILKKMYLY